MATPVTALLRLNGTCPIWIVCFSTLLYLLVEAEPLGLDSSGSRHDPDNADIHCGPDIWQARANCYDRVREAGSAHRVGRRVSFPVTPAAGLEKYRWTKWILSCQNFHREIQASPRPSLPESRSAGVRLHSYWPAPASLDSDPLL